jgi:hypothetical protein
MGKDIRDWMPVLKGKTYCSPACGSGCTKKAYDTAHAKAEKLAEQMGKGWRVYVWENMGWHYKVKNRELEIWAGHAQFILFCNGDPQFVLQGTVAQALVRKAYMERQLWIKHQGLRLQHLKNTVLNLPE